MKILVISDIHANLTALQAVLSNAGEFDAAWCLGDLVGYGPDPNECIDLVRQMPDLICILGNHDAAALKQIESESFNPEARQAILWTQQALTDASLRFLEALPKTQKPAVSADDGSPQVTLAHGSPRQPVWEYLLDTHNANRNFDYFETPFCFVGHTHLPVIYQRGNGDSSTHLTIPEPNSIISMKPRAILNPGSVGQPRDRDPRSSFAIFNTDQKTWDYRRVAYNIREVQNRMSNAGLPARHIQRLAGGW